MVTGSGAMHHALPMEHPDVQYITITITITSYPPPVTVLHHYITPLTTIPHVLDSVNYTTAYHQYISSVINPAQIGQASYVDL